LQQLLTAEQSSQAPLNGSSQQQAIGPSQPFVPSPLPQQVQHYSSGAQGLPSADSSPAPAAAQPQFPPGVKVAQGDQQIQIPQQQSIGTQRPLSANATQQLPPQLQRSSVPSAFPGSLSDLVVSFENVKQKGWH
jgi:CCR4-NOT transcription complex subunit 3